MARSTAERSRRVARFALAAALAAGGARGAGQASPPPAGPEPVAIVLRAEVPAEALARLGDAPGARGRVLARLAEVARASQRTLLERLRAERGVTLEPSVALVAANAIVAAVTPEMSAWLRRQPEVARIVPQPARPVFLGLAPDGPPEAAWGLERTGARQVHRDLGFTGRGAVVAVIDTGICPDHPGLAGRIWVNPGEDLDGDGEPLDPDDENGVDDDGNGYVDDLIGWDFSGGDNRPLDEVGHGSHVAGIVAGADPHRPFVGFAPGARVMALRVGSGSAREADVWAAIDYALANGADVISLSLGWRHAWHPDRATWRRVVDAAVAAGVPVVAAAGNEGRFDTVRTPADVPSALAVGASSLEERVATFSSRGPTTWQDVAPYNDFPLPEGLLKPDLVAPGVDVPSHDLCAGLFESSGTSMAAPAVAGAIAVLREIDPDLSPAGVRQLLTSRAADIGAPGPDNSAGHGRIDLLAAAQAARGPLRAAGHGCDDAAGGDGDGAPEPGETLRLAVTLENAGASPAGAIVARLVSETPAAIVLDPEARYPDLAPGERAAPVGPGFLLRIEGPCAAPLRFRVEVRARSGQGTTRSVSLIRDHTGRPVETVLFEDDMERERGWRTSGDARDGGWVRAVPRGTTDSGRPAAPGEDASPAGVRAWVTGNDGLGPADDDLDGGQAVLASAPLDARGFLSLELSYARWLYVGARAHWPLGHGELAIEVSDDGGAAWRPAEVVRNTRGGWRRVTVPLDRLAIPGPDLRVRARAVERSAAGEDLVVEAALDDVVIRGMRLVCDAP